MLIKGYAQNNSNWIWQGWFWFWRIRFSNLIKENIKNLYSWANCSSIELGHNSISVKFQMSGCRIFGSQAHHLYVRAVFCYSRHFWKSPTPLPLPLALDVSFFFFSSFLFLPPAPRLHFISGLISLLGLVSRKTSSRKKERKLSATLRPTKMLL